MHFIAEKNILLATLRTVYRAVPSKPLHALADHFAFEFVGDRLTVTATDSVTTIIGTVKSYQSHDQTGRVVVHAKTLMDYVKHVPEGPVRFEAGSQFLIVASGLGEGSQTLPLADASLYPKAPHPEDLPESEWFHVPREQFIEALTRVMPAVPGDATQQNVYMVSVQLNPQTENPVFIASNGARLHHVEAKNFFLPAMSIHALCLGQLMKALMGTDYEHVLVWKGKSTFVVKCGLDYAVFNAPQATFPDVHKTITQPTIANNWTLYVDRDSLKQALMRAAGTVDETTRAVKMRLSDQGTLTLETKNSVGAKVEEVLSIHWPYASTQLVFNIRHILDVLNVYPSAMCDIRIADPKVVPHGAVRFVDTDAAFMAVVAQMKLDVL